MYIQLNVDESLNLLKKNHDMYIQLNVDESLNLLKKKHDMYIQYYRQKT